MIRSKAGGFLHSTMSTLTVSVKTPSADMSSRCCRLSEGKPKNSFRNYKELVDSLANR